MSHTVLNGEIDLQYALEHLTDKQREFLQAPEANVGFVGGVGSGKTAALVISAIVNAMEEPNGFSLIGRRNIPALRDTTMRSFLEMCPVEFLRGGLAGWKPSEMRATFVNGHEIIFKHLDISDPKVSGHIRSLNLSSVYVDEFNEISEETYFLLLTRLRRSTTKVHRFRGATNAGGHDWVWRHFFGASKKANHRGILSKTQDNTNLPPDFFENLQNIFPADWQERFLYASFADFSDLVYKDFSELTHVWNPAGSWEIFGGRGNPPEHWPVIVGVDVGGGDEGDPWAIVLISVADDGTLYQFAEVYGTGLKIEPIAHQMHSYLEGRSMIGLAYDYAQRAAAQELGEFGIHGVPAIKEVTPGLMKTAQYMHIDGRIEHPFMGRKGAPRFFVSAACQHTLSELSGYKWGKDRSGRPTGMPAHDHSHLPDAIRYAIHTFRPEARELPLPGRHESPLLSPASREYWRFEDKRDQKLKDRGRGRSIETYQEFERRVSETPRRFRKPSGSRFNRPYPLG